MSETSASNVEELVKMLTEAASANKSIKKKGTKEITTTVEKSTETRTIIVPENMTLLEASKELEAMHKNQEQVVNVDRTFEGWDWKDTLIATKVISELTFGWINGVTTKGMMGEERPAEIDVTVDVKNGEPITQKCFTGKFSIAAWEKALATVGFNGMNAYISVKAKKKYSDAITKYFDTIEQHLHQNSIYRGKTVVVTNRPNASGMAFDYEIIENRTGDVIVLNDNEQLVVDEFILGQLGEPGKRSYLFTGPYGNGKTETAMKIGREANDLGMAFFYIKDSNLFETVLNRSKKYQPCIIFLEDVDEIGAGEERDGRMNKILNTLDGVQTKGNSLTVIFTTNHENKINIALRRPGRIDEVIKFVNPDIETKITIMEKYLSGIQGAKDIDYVKLANNIGDVSGSVVAQICKKAVRLALKTGKITDKIIDAATESMRFHIKFMNGDVEGVPIERQFTDLLSKIVNADVDEKLHKVDENITKIAKNLGMSL